MDLSAAARHAIEELTRDEPFRDLIRQRFEEEGLVLAGVSMHPEPGGHVRVTIAQLPDSTDPSTCAHLMLPEPIRDLPHAVHVADSLVALAKGRNWPRLRKPSDPTSVLAPEYELKVVREAFDAYRKWADDYMYAQGGIIIALRAELAKHA